VREGLKVRSAYHDTADSASLHPGPSSPRALSTVRTTAHKHHPFTTVLYPYRYYHQNKLPYTQHKHHPSTPVVTARPAKREHRPATVRPPRLHQHPIHHTVSAVPQTAAPLHRIARRTTPTECATLQRPVLPFPRRFRPCTRIAYCCSLGHVSTNTDYANDAPRLGWAWTPDVPHSRRRLTSALWTTRAALELKSLPT
jgi:hypothetical protein